MIVLQVCAFAAPNAGNFIASLTHLEEQLAEKGIQTIYAFADGAEDKPWCQEIQKRTKVYFLPTAKARILPKTYHIFRKIYAENDVNIMHSHFELYDIPATVTAPQNVRIFWHLHDAIKLQYQTAGNMKKLLTRIQYSSIWKRPMILSVSKEHAMFVNHLGFRAKRICYFPNGINTQRIQRTPLHKKHAQFLMFGWEVERKGVDLVVSAAESLEQNSCVIRIVGQTECKNYLNAHVGIPCIVYQEPIEDINLLYQNTSVFLHVSRAEGLSYALLEVIYAGIPVICSDIPENDFAHAFRNVYFVKNQDPDGIRDLILEFSKNPPAPSTEDNAYNRSIINQEYSLDAWSRRLISLYLE